MFLILKILLAVTALARADEGFHPVLQDDTPAAVRAVDRATVALWGDDHDGKSSLSAAFLVKTKTNGKHLVGLFLTNAHALTKCGGGAPCEYQVYFHYKIAMGRKFSLAKDSWSAAIKSRVAFDPVQDLAAFTVDLPRDPGPLPQIRQWTASDGRHLYALGSPRTTLRIHWNVPKPPPEPQILWSQGEGIAYQDVQWNKKNNFQRILFHTCDLLPGNSGGPLIDSQGRIVGVNTRAAKNPDYNGESTNQSIPAETLLRFIDDIQF